MRLEERESASMRRVKRGDTQLAAREQIAVRNAFDGGDRLRRKDRKAFASGCRYCGGSEKSGGSGLLLAGRARRGSGSSSKKSRRTAAIACGSELERSSWFGESRRSSELFSASTA
jgi:hypothetical protein